METLTSVITEVVTSYKWVLTYEKDFNDRVDWVLE